MVIFHMKRFCAICFKTFMRILGPIMLLAANILIGCIVYAFLFYVVPQVCDGDVFTYSLHFIFGMYILINVLFNYMACAFTEPGYPKVCNNPGQYLGERVAILDGRKVTQFRHKVQLAPAVSYRWCRHCKCIKPPRAHHDSISGKCVLDMDHFCPWMSNCVGFYNYRYFMLFMIYLLIGCIYVLTVCVFGYWSLKPDQT